MNHTNNEHEETTDAEDHPAAARAAPAHHLAPKIRSSPSSGTGASSVPTTSTTVASLIQSAAKISLLDDDRHHQHSSAEQPAAGAAAATHSTRLFDDDEYDDPEHGTIEESPSLKSLQKQALPILPDEQDRKRFVGCLAAVLASLYDYDDDAEGDENDYDPDDMSNYPADSVGDSFYEDWDDDGEDNDYSSNQARPSSTSENYGSSNNKTTAAAPSPVRRGGPKRQFLRRNHRHSPAKQHRPPAQAGQTTTSSSSSSRRRQSTASDAASLAQQRHRRRRYEVYARFLASSAELLLLDESQGKCFVPMLSKLASSSSSVHKRKKKNAPPAGFASSDRDFLEYQVDRIEHLRVFWEALGPGAGLRCLSMFLLQHLLHGSSSTGYDARIRHAVKTLGVLVLLHDRLLEDDDEEEDDDEQGCQVSSGLSQLRRSASTERRGFWASPRHDPNMNLVTMATRRFESLEHFIASKLIELSKAERELEMEHQRQQQRGKRMNGGAQKSGSLASREASANSRDRIIRGLKIGGTAVAAGTLFAITGGLGK